MELYRRCLFAVIVFISISTGAQKPVGAIRFTLSMDHPETQTFQVQMEFRHSAAKTIRLTMPVWTPGYYQKMNYSGYVNNFSVTTAAGDSLSWQKDGADKWQISVQGKADLLVRYQVKANRSFVASNFLDTTRGYIVPAGVFMYVDDQINHPVRLAVKPYHKWNDVATGLDKIPGLKHAYTAPNFDVLYDSPLLIGNLETLPSFTVKGIPHFFTGYQLGEFDRNRLVADLKKMVEAASDIIGDIPYRHYTFIAIGPGAGGIEHLNSTTISFNGSALNNKEGRIRLLHFLAHEYFHHYNVKRIRPIELGPFDYDRGSHTNMLWVAEGLTVYYEYLILRRAGMISQQELFNSLGSAIRSYEQKPGRFFQTLVEASAATWSEGPFGRTGDEVNKTISYYEKGSIVGLLLDLAIRQSTGNQKSLDDVMRTLYSEFYLKKNRGFTELEFRKICERIAGRPLSDIFEYTNTTKELNYSGYFTGAGLHIDTTLRETDRPYVGTWVQKKGENFVVSLVDDGSPARQAGIREGDEVIAVNGRNMDSRGFNQFIQSTRPGDTIHLQLAVGTGGLNKDVVVSKKWERRFDLKPLNNPDALQQKILNDWSR